MVDIPRVALALLRKDYPTFARRVFTTVSRGEDLSRDPYVEVLFQAALDVYSGDAKRTVVNLPPRHGKTLGFVVPLVAWWIANRPNAQIMILSFREGLAEQIVDHVNQVLAAEWFGEAFPNVKLRAGHNRTGDFGTSAAGRVFAHHLGRGITGEGADLIIIDDPADISDAFRPDVLTMISETFDNVVRNRLNHPKDGCIAIIGHRVHADDLSGHVLSEDGWAHVNLPFIAERAETHPVPGGVWRRAKGELLQRDGFPDTELAAIESRQNFPAVYQQTPEGEPWWRLGAEHFQAFVDVPASAGGTVFSVDTAQVAGAGHSFSVVQVWRAFERRHFLIDQLRAQISTTGLQTALRRLINRHRPSVVLIENSGFGTSLLEQLQRRGKGEGLAVVAVSTNNRSKFERFSEVVPIIETRALHLPRNALWSAAYIQELINFPGGDADDQVDATSQYLAWSRDNPIVRPRPQRALGVVVTEGGRTYVPGPSRINRAGLPGAHIFSRR